MDDETKHPQNPYTLNLKNNNLIILKALKQASHTLQKNHDTSSPSIKALLDLPNEPNSILSNDPYLSTLSKHLTHLNTLIHTSSNTYNSNHGIKSFLSRRVNSHEIQRVAREIEKEIQAWIDREFIETLERTLFVKVDGLDVKDDVLVDLIEQFEERIAKGFDRDLQDLILRSKVFYQLETILCDGKYTNGVRECCAFAIAELIKFNKDVFVGLVLIGDTMSSLVSLASVRSINILSKLINYIKSPAIDEIVTNGEIPKIVSFLNNDDVQIRAMAMECVLEIGYFGRKEAIDAMLQEGLVKKLVDLQRSESKVFVRCVVRFAIQLEVGEGLRKREKRELKQEVLKRVREACVSDAEAATIVAEVLWGASP
ncbi:Armadillo-like helical [Artemisia annua]|uniref:Armadillo-like helical n=1 Tax=Artemisia annua TaxID=35608 RepID=A0A2U1M711_ARTAN|nr:Armadillo-like helical [Artemisia annua]